MTENLVGITDFSRAFLRWRIDTTRKPPATVSQKLPMTLNNVRMPIECRTVVESGGRVVLEYPVKTVNFSERERFYQVDTGPVLLPDASARIEGCRLAYVAHNEPDWAEFIVNVPTALSDTIQVHHYSQVERVEPVSNRMIEVLP